MEEPRSRARRRLVAREDIVFEFTWLIAPVGTNSNQALFARFSDFEGRVSERQTLSGPVGLIELKDKEELSEVMNAVKEVPLEMRYYRLTPGGQIVQSTKAQALREVSKLGLDA
jgi:hypothetical protein